MVKIIGALGVDVKLLLANIVNFVILVYILKKFAYKPILQFIEERTAKIKKGVEDAELAKTNLADATTQREQVLLQARQEAQQIIEQAKSTATQKTEQAVQHSRTESEKIVKAAQLQIKQEQTEALQAAKREVADLVIQASEKLLRKKIDPATDQVLIDKTLSELHV